MDQNDEYWYNIGYYSSTSDYLFLMRKFDAHSGDLALTNYVNVSSVYSHGMSTKSNLIAVLYIDIANGYYQMALFEMNTLTFIRQKHFVNV